MKRNDVFSDFRQLRKSMAVGFGVVFIKKNGSLLVYGDPKDAETRYVELIQNYEGARVLHGDAAELYVRN